MAVVEEIRNNISKSRDGSLFFNNSFPLYDDEYVRQVLSDLCRQGIIVRIAFGIYLKPMKSKFGIVYPPLDDIITAVAKRDNAQILPTGNTAINRLGLSTQIPMNPEYITNGSAREIKIGKQTIHLKRSVPKNFSYKGNLLPVLVQALKAIGKDNMTDSHIETIRTLLKEHPEDKTWQKDVLIAPAWIRKVLTKIKNEITNDKMDR